MDAEETAAEENVLKAVEETVVAKDNATATADETAKRTAVRETAVEESVSAHAAAEGRAAKERLRKEAAECSGAAETAIRKRGKGKAAIGVDIGMEMEAVDPIEDDADDDEGNADGEEMEHRGL